MLKVEKTDKLIAFFIACLDLVVINLLFFMCQHFFSEDIFNARISGDDMYLYIIVLSLSLCYMIATGITGIISYRRRVRPDQIVLSVMKNVIVFSLFWLTLSFVLDFNSFSIKSIACYFAIVFIVVAALRLLCYNIIGIERKRGRNKCNVIFVGQGVNLIELYAEMTQNRSTGYNVVGYFNNEKNTQFEDNTGCEYCGRVEDVIDYLKSNAIDRVYCGLSSKYGDLITPIIDYCEDSMVRFFSVPNFRNYCNRRVTMEMFSNVPILSLREEPLCRIENQILKRLFDIVFSFLFLVTVFPILLLVFGILIKLSSPGPIFFKQERHGLNGKVFKCYKFRSMKVNTDANLLEATKDDPRKTKIGEFMRKTSIDEMPQFINVFLNDMSVVGPRPHMLQLTEEYASRVKNYRVRLYAKQGITGWAQVTGFRGDTQDIKDLLGRVNADVWYLEHWTFMLDLYIIYKTVANIVGGKDKKAF